MQAALCNTRVFTARTQSRSASRRSVRVQAADRTLWLPGKGRQEPGPPQPAPPQLPSCPARAEPPPTALYKRRMAHSQRRWAASSPAELPHAAAAPRPPTLLKRCPLLPAAGIQAPKHLDGKLAGGENTGSCCWTACAAAQTAQPAGCRLCALFRCRRPICKLMSHFALSLLADYGFGEPELVTCINVLHAGAAGALDPAWLWLAAGHQQLGGATGLVLRQTQQDQQGCSLDRLSSCPMRSIPVAAPHLHPVHTARLAQARDELFRLLEP